MVRPRVRLKSLAVGLGFVTVALCVFGLTSTHAYTFRVPDRDRDQYDSGHAGNHGVLDFFRLERKQATQGLGNKCNTKLSRDAKVDLVYTWVNYSSPAWQKEWPSGVRPTPAPNTFRELKYSLRSLVKYGLNKILGKIYIVINPVHGPPSYIDTSADNGRVVIVAHDKIFRNPKSDLPTNNRNAIMANIHRIPGLSEWFLYAEDDMLLGKQFDISRHYDFDSQKIKTVLTHGIPPKAVDSNWEGAMYHSDELLTGKFGKRERGGEGLHTAVLVNKCVLAALEMEFEKDFNVTSADAKAADGAKNIQWQTLYENYVEDIGIGKRADPDSCCGEVHTNADAEGKGIPPKELREKLDEFSSEKYQWVNVQGPGISDEYPPNAELKRMADSWFDKMYPTPSPWEWGGVDPTKKLNLLSGKPASPTQGSRSATTTSPTLEKAKAVSDKVSPTVPPAKSSSSAPSSSLEGDKKSSSGAAGGDKKGATGAAVKELSRSDDEKVVDKKSDSLNDESTRQSQTQPKKAQTLEQLFAEKFVEAVKRGNQPEKRYSGLRRDMAQKQNEKEGEAADEQHSILAYLIDHTVQGKLQP